MFCQTGFAQWLMSMRTPLPHLRKPQAAVLALWSLGMVLARWEADYKDPWLILIPHGP